MHTLSDVRHTRDKCYKLIGYPSGWKLKDVNKHELGTFNVNKTDIVANNSIVAPSSGKQFTNEQVNQLNKMLEMFKDGMMDKSQTQWAGTIHTYATVLDDESWLVDSGASCHFTYNSELLENMCELKNACSVRLPNGQNLRVKYSGDCRLNTELVLHDVFCVPEFKVDLISVSKIIKDDNCTVQFSKIACIVQDQNHKVLQKLVNLRMGY